MLALKYIEANPFNINADTEFILIQEQCTLVIKKYDHQYYSFWELKSTFLLLHVLIFQVKVVVTIIRLFMGSYLMLRFSNAECQDHSNFLERAKFWVDQPSLLDSLHHPVTTFWI